MPAQALLTSACQADPELFLTLASVFLVLSNDTSAY